MPGERGQVVPLLAVALVLSGVLAVGLVRVAVAASGRAAAQAAADAAALAGAAEGLAAAERVAADNGAAVVSYRSDDADVTVVVRRGRHRATATARWDATAAPVGRRPGQRASSSADPGRCQSIPYTARRVCHSSR